MRSWLITVLAILYILSPIDFIPDVIPVLGWLDDIVAFLLLLRQLLTQLGNGTFIGRALASRAK